MRRATLVAVALAAACGGSSSPTRPSPPPAPPPTTFTLAGQVAALQSGTPLAGASVTAAGQTTTTGAGGAFSLTLGSSSATELHVSAPGVLERRLWVRPGAVHVTAIAEAGFDLAFYRAFVRNGHQAPDDALEPLRRWTVAPRVYLQTTDATGAAVPEVVLARVRDVVTAGVSSWSGWTLAVAGVESGPEARAEQSGWLQVVFVRDPTAGFCGRSFVGANPGRITLNLLPYCGCDGVSPRTVLHELGHAMGFWHTPDAAGGVMPMANPGACTEGVLSDAEGRHAWIAYQRPVGNRDVDADPSSALAALAGVARRIEVID